MTASAKVAVLGLDGVPFDLLNDLFHNGVMPGLADVAENSTFVRMETSLPAVSSVAWSSFMTGRGPGHHGIFGFTDLKNRERSLRLPSFDDIQCPVIWQSLAGRKATVINLPFTYPARPLNGLLISGFVAPMLERSVFPPSLLPWLASRHYRIDVDAVKGRHDRRHLFEDLFETLNVHEEVMLTLMEREPWDLFIGVVTGTDRLHHFFFDAARDPNHVFFEDFMEYYRRIDSFFRRFVERLGRRTRLIVLSDHGFTLLKTQVYVNHLLERMGRLSFIRANPQSIEDVHPSSEAFAMEPNRIYLNSKDRFRDGLLDPRQKPEILSRLKQDLERVRLRDAGIDDPEGEDRPDDVLFMEVRSKEAAYDGPCRPMAPDLLLIPRRGYDLKATIGVRVPSMRDVFTGTHTHDDAFLIVNDPYSAIGLTQARIENVADLIREVLD
ncbi:MAG: alkaline phosphatase family protein [Deltaproteobacteria bacterium]